MPQTTWQQYERLHEAIEYYLLSNPEQRYGQAILNLFRDDEGQVPTQSTLWNLSTDELMRRSEKAWS